MIRPAGEVAGSPAGEESPLAPLLEGERTPPGAPPREAEEAEIGRRGFMGTLAAVGAIFAGGALVGRATKGDVGKPGLTAGQQAHVDDQLKKALTDYKDKEPSEAANYLPGSARLHRFREVLADNLQVSQEQIAGGQYDLTVFQTSFDVHFAVEAGMYGFVLLNVRPPHGDVKSWSWDGIRTDSERKFLQTFRTIDDAVDWVLDEEAGRLDREQQLKEYRYVRHGHK